MKPIHKFNNGNGATLCHRCSVIISIGLTDDLYCKECRKKWLQDMMKADEELGLYNEPFRHKGEVLSKEEILANRSNAYDFIDFDKQETLEEYAERRFPSKMEMYEVLIEGAKWQQEQDKKLYSEEDLREAFDNGVGSGKYQQEYGENSRGYMNFYEWFEQFKKK